MARLPGPPKWLALVGASAVVLVATALLLISRQSEPRVAARSVRPADARLVAVMPTATSAPYPTATRVTRAVALSVQFEPVDSDFESKPEAQSPRPVTTPAPLPPAFRTLVWSRPEQEALAEARQGVDSQLAEFPALAPYRERLMSQVGQRVRFLSPLEYLIWVSYDRQPAHRDQLLTLYQQDPHAALKQTAQEGLWPSNRSELLLESPGQYDVDEELVLVNRGETDDSEAKSVLVHELWHALPHVRVRQEADGAVYRTTGFWTQRQDPDSGIWMPLESRNGLIFPAYLLDEAMAYRQEWRGTGLQPKTNEAVEHAARLLDHAEAILGPERLLSLYLESDEQGFLHELDAYHDELAEFFSPG
jgi:hypothetical protein